MGKAWCYARLLVIVLVMHWSSDCTAVCHHIHLYKEVQVTTVESDFTEFLQRLRKQEGRMDESLKQGNKSWRRRQRQRQWPSQKNKLNSGTKARRKCSMWLMDDWRRWWVMMKHWRKHGKGIVKHKKKKTVSRNSLVVLNITWFMETAQLSPKKYPIENTPSWWHRHSRAVS